ncbi:MAG: translation initiation factor IF-3 [Patescibacteria group bacterium]
MGKYSKETTVRVRINERITAPELRVIGAEGENLGVLSREAALTAAKDVGLDLIEISPTARPPVAKIMEYGKYLYAEKKKQREQKVKSHSTETKSLQMRIGTSEHSLGIKAKQASEWLSEGHRVKFELFLQGRAKYLDKKFLEERMQRFLKLLTVDYKVAEPPTKSAKGMALVIEKGK